MGGLAFTIVLGANCPLTAAQIRQHVKSADSHVEVVTYVSDLTSSIAEADLVISMCGYNTMFELIEAQKKIIAVPRGHSGYEQTLRARLLSGIYDGLWVIPQNEFSPKKLAIAIADALEAPPPQVRIPMNGASNLIAHLVSLVPR
jgi:predicted glycosyltransferase